MLLVEIAGSPRLQPACFMKVSEGMDVRTDTDRLREYRRMIVELLFAEGNHICSICVANGACELQDMAIEVGMDHERFEYVHPRREVDLSHDRFGIDHNRCILCTRCVRACDELEGARTWDVAGRGGNELRGDDGLGPLVARSLAAAVIPGVCVRIARQLLPELAADLAEAQLAIFVDASVESCEMKAVRLQSSEDTCAWCTHRADPGTLLALTQVAYRRTPEAWWLAVPGRNFAFGEGLSNVARKNARQAIFHLTSFIQAWQRCSPK